MTTKPHVKRLEVSKIGNLNPVDPHESVAVRSGPLPNSLPFEDRRQALSYPDAERRDAARGAGASHLVDQRRGQAGAAATKRVTDRNRAAVDVQFCVVDAQLALAGEGLRGERLVQLEQVDAVERKFRA